MFPLQLAPDQVRVITLNDDAALINYAQPIVAELRESMVRVDADFSATRSRRRFPTRNNGESTPCSSSAVATWKPV